MKPLFSSIRAHRENNFPLYVEGPHTAVLRTGSRELFTMDAYTHQGYEVLARHYQGSFSEVFSLGPSQDCERSGGAVGLTENPAAFRLSTMNALGTRDGQASEAI